ncbi:alpha/beta hydrolase [Winogradskyella endarachnes]|uniref:Alpha/beta fold hydrolase n=1 Tax=Winogradskyella endarachnes TaxID=2681965 RepID=A0A6L6U7N5_9FLAO|nr:alpha/beta fold hydrolase [Winogradskyella endarachnes]MUU77606.1 alpha/beta fold hydrolase [Winogradskyella endarachnes]
MRNSTPKRRFKILKRIIVIIVIFGVLITHFIIPRLITEIRNPVVNLINRNKVKTAKITLNDNKDIKRKDLIITSFDSINLSGRLSFSSLDSTKGTIILLHGIRSNKEAFLELSTFLAQNGFNSFALDSRAHGESEGQFCTFGVNEKQDVKNVIDYLINKEQLNNIGIWGQSLGGAIGLQAMGFDKRIKFGIIESTFSDFRSIVHDYFQLNVGFSYKPFSNYLVNRAADIANFNVNDANPLLYCKKITQPIIVVHGTKDDRININYGKANFLNIKSKNKEFLEVENANHLNVWKTGGTAYFEKLLQFLNKNSVKQLKIKDN